MKKEYIVELREEEADELMDEHWVGDLVRCKDCVHNGKVEKCVLAAIAAEKGCPLFMLDNCGEWYCADGEMTDNDA